VTVGTVQYMAPEIGQGRYDFSIDIYALGIVLYEMLTGQVPFFGASPAEVLMKHLMDEPNLTGINEPFAHAIQKALVKDPALRYKTVQEMAEDVFGPEHIRDSVSQFRPEELSVIAQHVAAKVRAQSQASEQPTRPSGPKEKDRSSGMAQMGEQIGHKIGSAGDRIAEGLAGATSGLERRLSRKANGPDAIGRRQRLILAIVIMAVISLAVGLFRGAWRDGDFTVALVVFLMMAGLVKGILWAEYRLLEGLEQGPFRNCLAAGLGILVAAVVAGLGGGIAGWTLLSLLVLVFVNWRRVSAPDRARQIDWAPVVWAGVIGGLVALPEGQPLVSVGLIAGTILAVQVVSPFGGGASAAVETGPPPSVPDTPSPTPTPPAPASVPGPEEEDQPADPQALPATSLTPETTVPASGPEETPMNGQSATSAPRSNNQASVVAVQARPPRPRSVLAGLSAFIGYLLLIVGLLIGLLFSLHVILFASAVDQGLARDFEQEMGSDWPYLVELIGGFVTGLFLILALIFLILARRRRGVSHLIRAVAGIAILAVFLFCLFYATPGRLLVVSPTFQAGTGQPGPVLAQALRAVQIPYLIGSLVALIGGVTVLAWPAGDRQSRPDLPVYNRAADPPCS